MLPIVEVICKSSTTLFGRVHNREWLIKICHRTAVSKVYSTEVINQMEVPLGILPGGGGTQRLPRLVGRGRALEIILAGDDLDAETAERWGYLNRTLDAAEIGPFVDGLAKRIASLCACRYPAQLDTQQTSRTKPSRLRSPNCHAIVLFDSVVIDAPAIKPQIQPAALKLQC